MKNVLYIIWSLGLGGAERVVINLAKGLDKTAFKPMVCCLNDKGRFADELEKEGVKVIALHKKPGLDLGIINKLVTVMKENEIDVVNTHLWGANFWGRIAAKKAKVPVVIATEHNLDEWKSWYHFVLDRWLSAKTDKIIAVAGSVKEFYVGKGIDPAKIRVVYNGIAIKKGRILESVPQGAAGLASCVREEFRVSDGEAVLAVIGRLVQAKGHRYLFDALSQLNAAFKVKLLVVGDGPLSGSLQRLVRSRKLDDKVIFTGLRRDIPRLLEAIDIVVMPSLREGLPIVALEAMSHAVPVVATNVGGTAEVIEHDKTGVLVAAQNPIELSQALEKLLNDRDLRLRMGRAAAQRAEESFSSEKMIKETQALYEELLGSKARS